LKTLEKVDEIIEVHKGVIVKKGTFKDFEFRKESELN
jgi:hypothetical protein